MDEEKSQAQGPAETALHALNVLYLGFCEICRVAERDASDQYTATLRPIVGRNPADHRRSLTGHIHCHGGLHRSPSRLHRYTAVSIRIIDTTSCIVCGRVYVTLRRPSVRLSVRLSHLSTAAAAYPWTGGIGRHRRPPGV